MGDNKTKVIISQFFIVIKPSLFLLHRKIQINLVFKSVYIIFEPEKMKRLLLTILTSMAFTTSMFSETQVDSLVMNRMYRFLQSNSEKIKGFSTNVYTKHLYQVHKRNVALMAIPSMYTISKGERVFVSEEYSKFTFNEIDNYENHRQVYCTTIPRNRRTMAVLLTYLAPNFYNVTLYEDNILSPFSRENHIYYHFRTIPLANQKTRLYFRPRIVPNTQLVSGKAILDNRTGRIEQVEMEGEFDMIKFKTLTMMGEEGAHALLPKICQTAISFKFGGNHITSQFEAIFDCPITLADSINVKGDRLLMDSIRPISLSEEELFVWEQYDRKHGLLEEKVEEPEPDTIQITQTWIKEEEPQPSHTSHHNYLKEIGWNLIGENLIHSLSTESEKGYIKLSPILDPQYISYSHNKGLSYRIKLGARYKFTDNSFVNFNPHIGYNFKFREFYYKAPFHWYFNHEKDNGIELIFGNDNRIGNSTILDEIKREYGNIVDVEGKDLDLFDDNYIRFLHHIQANKKIRVETGMVFHNRQSLNAEEMAKYGKETQYFSLAPSLSIKWRPTRKAPIFSVDYERGLKINHKYIDYERWEADASFKYPFCRTQLINARFGGGLYTAKDNDFFMDFANFRDNNIPGGWDDDFAGNFQLLSSRLYNESNYYIRGNVSFETPLLAGYLVPLVGRYVERERVYISSLSIDHTRLYSELGYGFTCRIFSMGLFTSFLNYHYQDMGCKFTFELFSRW